MARHDDSLQRGETDGIGPIASPSPDDCANRRERRHYGHRPNIRQACTRPTPHLLTYAMAGPPIAALRRELPLARRCRRPCRVLRLMAEVSQRAEYGAMS